MDIDIMKKVTGDLINLLCKKNAAYGNAFEDDLNEFGLTASAIQMGHKMKRLKTLLKGDVSDNGESITDSIKDLVGYGLLTLEWLSRQDKKKPRSAEEIVHGVVRPCGECILHNWDKTCKDCPHINE